MKIKPFFWQHTLIFIFCLCLICGCGSPYKSVNLDPLKLFQEKGKNALNSTEASWETQQTLRLMFLDKTYRKDRRIVIDTLEEKVKQSSMPEMRTALAELSLIEARKHKKSDPQKAIVHYLLAAQQAYDFLFFDSQPVDSNPLTPSFRFMADIYNISVAELIAMRAKRPDKYSSKDFEHEGIHYHFEVVRNRPKIWDPALFDYIHNSYEVRITGLTNEYITKGLGAPLIGIVEKPSEDPNFGRFFSPRIVAFPISAVLLFDPVKNTEPPSRDIRLVFYDSLQTDAVNIQGKNFPLEADFTTPLGLQLKSTNPFDVGIHNLIHSDVELKRAGIYMLEPYRPDKIPVLMVHGLMSSPATWANMFNDLRGDYELRKKYQFWFFMYPTGLPIGYSTSILRDQLTAVHEMYDPNSTNPNFNQMVLIGHSMGGLLSRGMVQDTGNTYWDAFFKEPFDTVNLDPNTKAILKNVMFFKHLPYVKRVVFAATPHRGSPMADQWYTKILSGMIALPSAVSDTTTKMARGNLTESASAAYTKQVSNSVRLLSPTSIFIQTTNKIPLESGIPYHSIIGTQKSVTSGAGTSDGIVPYESSHLDFAESEKLVPSGHGVQEHPLAIAEVKRILYEHLEKIK